MQNPILNQAISNQNLFQYKFGYTGAGKLQAELDALVSEGLITTLCEPERDGDARGELPRWR